MSNLDAAQEQADEYGSFTRSATITTRTGEKFTVGNPNLFDDDQLLAYQKLHHRMNKCDRWPDTEVPEQRVLSENPDGTKVETYSGAYTRRGEFIEPYQEKGKLVEPVYEVQVAQIVLGDKYAAFKAAKGSSRELVTKLAEMRQGTDKRADDDSKSVGSDSVLEVAPTPNSE